MPETVYLTCKKLNGENGCFTEVGNHVVSLYADVPTDINKYERKLFIISNVGESDKYLNARYYAEKYLEYCFCGNVYNVRSMHGEHTILENKRKFEEDLRKIANGTYNRWE